MSLKELLVVIFFFILLASFVKAMTLPQSRFEINCNVSQTLLEQNKTCLTEDCSVYTEKVYSRGGVYVVGVYVVLPNKTTETLKIIRGQRRSILLRNRGIFLSQFYADYEVSEAMEPFISVLDQICINNVSDIKPILVEKTEEWIVEKKNLGHADLFFKPYSENEMELWQRKSYKLTDCEYNMAERVGDWIVVISKRREYCFTDQTAQFKKVKLFYPSFFIYLLTHLNKETYPYLLWSIVILSIITSFIVYLYKRKELKKFIKPSMSNVLFTLLIGLLSGVFLLSLFGVLTFIKWLVIFYLFSCIIKYIYHRIKNHETSSSKH